VGGLEAFPEADDDCETGGMSGVWLAGVGGVFVEGWSKYPGVGRLCMETSRGNRWRQYSSDFICGVLKPFGMSY